jgi:hypothetical protein
MNVWWKGDDAISGSSPFLDEQQGHEANADFQNLSIPGPGR